MFDPGVPAESQTIPVRALAPAGAARLELRTDDGAILALPSPFASWLPALPGEHRVELWAPGESRPLSVARYLVH